MLSVVLCTTPMSEAKTIAQALVEERLVGTLT